eukprot:TRINITY_DN6100_c0_g1_i3.p1 TRINITY_DN6100_c0_g1~~TRINITY_DN6100_c0_g1_i3.p1  ORF type:complete len:142 (-),score=31.22 TRINITY_DN6100_c0_g1_i3:17-442(-)
MMKRSFTESSGQTASSFKLDVKIKQKLLESNNQEVETKLSLSLDQAAVEDYIVRLEIVPELLEEDQGVATKAKATAKPEEPVERLRKLWANLRLCTGGQNLASCVGHKRQRRAANDIFKGVCENHVARGNSFDGEYPDNHW